MMPEPSDWKRRTPDLLSRDLEKRTTLIVLGALVGLGAGVLSLLLAGPRGTLVWLGFSVVAIAVLFLLARYLELGIVAFLGVCWIAVGTPALAQGGSGGGAQQLKLSQAGLIVLLAVWAVRRLIQTQRGTPNQLYRAPVNVPICIYLVVSIWSTLNSLLFPNGLVLANGPKQFVQVNILEVLMRVLALGGLLLVANTLQGRTLKAACIAAILPGALTFTGLLTFIPPSNYLAFPQVLAMAVLTAIALTGEGWTPKWLRVLCGALALAILYTYFIKGAEWVSGWLGALVAVGVITYHARRKLFWTVIGVLALIIIVDFPYFYQTVYVSNFYGAGQTHDIARVGHMGTFTNDRTRMWGSALRYAMSFPLGIGLGNFRSYQMYFGRVDVWNTTTFTSAHGTYSQALSETGFAGLIALLLLLYTSGRMLKVYYYALPPGWSKTYVLGAWGGCVGVFCASFNGDYLFPTYHNGGMGSFGACVYTWFLVGLSVAIARENGLVWDECRERAATARPTVAAVYNRGPHASQSTAEEAPFP